MHNVKKTIYIHRERCEAVHVRAYENKEGVEGGDTLVVKGTYVEEFDRLVSKNRYSVVGEREREEGSEESSQRVDVVKLFLFFGSGQD